ncbi:hypothetical protein G7Y89_g12386 [Cudoniella acicularis]|uniref:F-actin-capping protein subunit beta n=1 Tax=Cudoniella acicularis TaxID=354080 RepID=A0A8H4RA67_9HELO|nr:hypothetical protein G7Y89_g12386 [Cudoniella acicularis]
MGNSSSIANPIVTDGPYISKRSPKVTGLEVSVMAATMDTHIPHHDDLNLMGLQELDSHLSIFDPTRDSTTPMSNSAYGESISTTDNPSTTIFVESPEERYPQTTQPENYFSSRGPKSVSHNIIQTDRNSKSALSGNMHLKPESARDSMASSMTTDVDDGSSALSSISSKATSPTGFEASSGENTKRVSQSGARRPKYDVRPKVSIPTDIAPAEYARQCIAAAESSRLNPYSMHTEEHAMLRKHLTHQQVTTYLNIRNGILRLWTRNPLIGVMRDEAIGCAKDARWFDIARICHEWLVRRGYINYGCLEHQEPTAATKKQRSGRRERKTIAVIGAGMSGLGCARQLESLFSEFKERFRAMGEDPPCVIVLEGRDRIGGRVYSRPFKSKPQYPTLSYGSRHTAEMGGMIITGFDRGNPLNIIVRGQLALPYHALRPDTTIYDATGKPVDANRDQFAEKLFNYILDRVSEYKFKLPTPPTADGDKDLLDAGRDVSAEGSKTISEVEDNPIAPSTNGVNNLSHADEVQMIPVSSDRLTGRAHLEPGIPAVHTAAYKAQEIGWLLRPGVGIEYDLDLERAVSSNYATLGSVFDEAIRQYTRIVDFTPLDLRLINWHVANLEYSNATTCNTLSLGGWDLDAGNEWEGKHTMVTGGYQQVPRGLLNCPQPLNVRKKSNVKSIAYNPEGNAPSKIVCSDGEIIDADYIVSTIPLGVLKRGDIKFEPPLPDWKNGAIQRIGYGILNKVVLMYREPFWDQSRDIFGTLRNPPDRFSLDQAHYFSQRGRFFQWFNCSNTSGLPTLIALMAGDAAFKTESMSNEAIVAEATAVLKTVFGPGVPAPVEAVVTRWGQDEFSRGSYSYTGPNFRPDDYEVMAKPIGNLFFAGEHTCGTHPATVHGAYISGLRVASEVLDTLLGPMEVPEPLILSKDSSSKRKSEALQSPKDPKQARLEAYEIEIWNAIWTKLGDRPWRPENKYANPYRMYSKDKWEEAKKKCEEGRRPGKGKPIPNEVKKMVTKMWKEAPEEEKKPYHERADAAKWDKDAADLRADYIRDHPSGPGPDEGLNSPSRKQRKAKRISGYAEDSGSELDLDLLRRLDPKHTSSHLNSLISLVPSLTEDLLSSVDQPLTIARCRKTGRDYLLCDYNRDGDSYRSPWSGEFENPTGGTGVGGVDDLGNNEGAGEGAVPSERVRKMEIRANEAFDVYRELYYEGGVSSVYFWNLDDGFAGVVLLKKVATPSGKSQGTWDSIHVFEAVDRARTAHYKLTSTVILHLSTGSETLGEMDLSGNMTRQIESDLPVDDDTSHIANIGKLVEDMELKMRNLLQEVYFGKAKDVVGDLRSIAPLTETNKDKATHQEMINSMKRGNLCVVVTQTITSIHLKSEMSTYSISSSIPPPPSFSGRSPFGTSSVASGASTSLSQAATVYSSATPTLSAASIASSIPPPPSAPPPPASQQSLPSRAPRPSIPATTYTRPQSTVPATIYILPQSTVNPTAYTPPQPTIYPTTYTSPAYPTYYPPQPPPYFQHGYIPFPSFYTPQPQLQFQPQFQFHPQVMPLWAPAPYNLGTPVLLPNGNIVYRSYDQQNVHQPWAQPWGGSFGLRRWGLDVKPGSGGLIPFWLQSGELAGWRPA